MITKVCLGTINTFVKIWRHRVVINILLAGTTNMSKLETQTDLSLCEVPLGRSTMWLCSK